MSTRTIADVIREWRESTNGTDDADLASRINYYITVEIESKRCDCACDLEAGSRGKTEG